MNSTRPLSLLVRTLLLCVASGAVAAERTILLADDHDVLYRAGTKRVLHPPARHERNPLITEDKPWELAIAWTSVHRDEKTGKYQLWYQAYAGDRAQARTHRCTVCYAESDDGISFRKPNLGLFDFNGEKNTNIVLLGSGGWGDRYCNSVIVDPRDPDPAGRYKMVFSDWFVDEREQVWLGTHLAFSPDGVRWTKHPGPPIQRSYYGLKRVQPPFTGENPYSAETLPNGRIRRTALLPLTHSDAADVLFDPKRNVFVLYGKMWIDGPDGGVGWKHAMGRSESKDFIQWSKPQLVCWPDDADGALEFHTSPAFFYRDRYFSLCQILDRSQHGTMDVELMISRDGIEWERPFRAPFFIPRGPAGQFDCGSILSNANLIIEGDQMRFYYGAYSSGAVGGGADIVGDQQKSGVGLATLPLDRFAGVRTESPGAPATGKAPPEIGQVTLKPIDLAGTTEISINANAAGGAVWGELLDENCFRVPGFDKANSSPLKEDALRFPLQWKDKKISELPPGRYHLRLHLQKAEVFAVTLR
jgi:hypothetical protein